ncbi:hypothetical protein [Bacillus sp. RO1]|uniref:hypothetical protein n=1 Tax=Bacillus sp. RO1 TaxID=2722703 RepID=UPI00145789D2|nr:hypothetical protein [Bacillus sp. RO1]NLP50257.1 hypothetical protein [Bacillus sp. RO1]
MPSFIENVETMSSLLYPHEKEALLKWNAKLKDRSCTVSEALIYQEACQTLIKTLKERIKKSELEKKLTEKNKQYA